MLNQHSNHNSLKNSVCKYSHKYAHARNLAKDVDTQSFHDFWQLLPAEILKKLSGRDIALLLDAITNDAQQRTKKINSD